MNNISVSTPTLPDQNTIPEEDPTEGWTKFPNCILDNLDKFTPMECKILMLMVRKNYGYQQPNMKFSLTYICQKIRSSKPTVIKAINGLLKKESIRISETGKKGVRYFDINWAAPVDTGKKILPVKKIDRSKNFTDTGKETLPPSFIKETIKKNDNVKTEPEAILEEKAVVEPTATSSSFFSQDDLNNLMQTVSQEKRTKDVEKRLVKALKAGHSIDYLLDAIAFSNDKATKNYLSHLGKSIDEDWAQEGYHKEAEKKRQQAEEVKRRRKEAIAAQKKKAEEEAEKEAAQKKKAEQVDALLDSIDLNALDAFIGDQDLNSFNRTRFNQGKRDLLRRQYVAEFCGKQPNQTTGPDSKPCKRPVQQDLFGFYEASQAPVKEKKQKKPVKTVDPILISATSYLRKKSPSQPKQMDVGIILESLEDKRINSKKAL